MLCDVSVSCALAQPRAMEESISRQDDFYNTFLKPEFENCHICLDHLLKELIEEICIEVFDKIMIVVVTIYCSLTNLLLE